MIMISKMFRLGLMVSASVPVCALAAFAAAPAFKPSAPWNVGSASAGGQQICAIRGDFDNGFIVQFEGSGAAPDAVNIDFRQDAFTEGQDYQVDLGVPGAGRKTFPAKAISSQTLNINFSGDRGIYSAMRDSSLVDMQIEGNDFRFHLAGLADADKSFSRCLAANATPAVPPPAPVAAAPAPVSADIQSAQAEPVAQSARPQPRPRLSEEIAEKIKNNPELVKNSATPDASAAKPAAPASAPPLQETQAPEILMPLSRLQQEKPGQQQASAAGTDMRPPEPAPQPPVFREETETLTPPPAQEPSPRKNSQVKNLRSPEPVVRKKTSTIEADFTRIPGPDAIEPASGGPDPELFRKISEMEHTIRELKEENVALNHELKSNVQAGEQERLSISSSDWNLERATMRYNEAERQIKRLGQQLQQERAQCSVDKQDLEGQLFDPQVTSQEQLAKLADLQQKLDEAREQLQSQRMRYEERIKILEKQPAAQ
ncbi:MAG: hypothetical protein IT558_04675 [Alphaproteobacteria bacterium]|nr:hypothetical protein [Alphaproteobacteria bacterium]